MAAKKTRKPLFPSGSLFLIKCKFREKQIVPHEAIDRMWMLCRRETPEDWKEWRNTPLRTTDGIMAKVSLIMCINDSDGSEDGYMDGLCKEVYGEDMTFEFMRTNWQTRMRISGYWHLIELEKV